MPCPARDRLTRQGDRGRKAAELGCGDTPRASYAPSGGERGVRPCTAGPTQRRSTGGEVLARDLLRLSIPEPPETSELGRVIGVVTSQAQADALLTGGWQSRRLLPGSEDLSEAQKEA